MSEKMKNGGGLIHAYLFDGTGGGRRLQMGDIESWTPEQGVLWVHFNYSSADAQQWLQNSADRRSRYAVIWRHSVMPSPN